MGIAGCTSDRMHALERWRALINNDRCRRLDGRRHRIRGGRWTRRRRRWLRHWIKVLGFDRSDNRGSRTVGENPVFGPSLDHREAENPTGGDGAGHADQTEATGRKIEILGPAVSHEESRKKVAKARRIDEHAVKTKLYVG
jgi:hypothetical protein